MLLYPTTVTYTHDAWGQLVEVTYGADVRASYEYNGQGERIVKQSDTTLNGQLDEQRMMFYSAGWQILEERIDADAEFTDDPNDTGDMERTIQYVWGARYIDDLVVRRRDGNFDHDYEDAGDDTWFHLTDGQFSTRAIIDESGKLQERVDYDPYGQARHHWRQDVDGDGDQDGSDLSIIQFILSMSGGTGADISNALYNVDADTNRDGKVDRVDQRDVNSGTQPALVKGALSALDSVIGFSGYVYNSEVELYTVRFRHYSVTLGRWLERDPLGYVDGSNLYGYVSGQPLAALDPFGLWQWDGGYVQGSLVGLWEGYILARDNLNFGMDPFVGWTGYADRIRDRNATNGWYTAGDTASWVGSVVMPIGFGLKFLSWGGSLSRAVINHNRFMRLGWSLIGNNRRFRLTKLNRKGYWFSWPVEKAGQMFRRGVVAWIAARIALRFGFGMNERRPTPPPRLPPGACPSCLLLADGVSEQQGLFGAANGLSVPSSGTSSSGDARGQENRECRDDR